MTLAHKIEPGDPIDADIVELNFNSFAIPMITVSTNRVEDGSIDTRHISATAGAWKEVTKHTGTPVTSGSAIDLLLSPPVASTDTVTHTGGMTIVIAKCGYRGTGSGDTDCGLRIDLDGSAVRTATIELDDDEWFGFSTVYAFKATAETHVIEFCLVGAGSGTNFVIINPELHVYSVRG